MQLINQRHVIPASRRDSSPPNCQQYQCPQTIRNYIVGTENNKTNKKHVLFTISLTKKKEPDFNFIYQQFHSIGRIRRFEAFGVDPSSSDQLCALL